MIVTEADAAQRWCPFARVLLPVHQAGNRISTFHKECAQREANRGGPNDLKHYEQQERDCNCIGSRCMAWRWAGYQPVPSVVHGQDEAHGFCGLAGKPPQTG